MPGFADIILRPATVDPRDALHALGWLAPWLLTDARLGDAGLTRATPHRNVGSAPVLFVNGSFEATRDAAHVAEAFALPLRWEAAYHHAKHDPTLPAGVIQQANAVLQHVGGGAANARLTWDRGGVVVDPPDLSTVELHADSGFATLAAAYLGFVDKRPSDPAVWASACYDGHRFTRVDGLAAKLAAAAAMGATRFFVAAEQEDEAKRLARRRVKIEALREQHPARAADLLAPLRLAMQIAPGADAAPDDKGAYYAQLVEADLDAAAEAYLCGHLLDDVGGHMAREVDAALKGGTLVLTAGLNRGLIEADVIAFRPKRLVVLASARAARAVTDVIGWVRAWDPGVDVVVSGYEDTPERAIEWMRAQLPGHLADAPRPLVLELTGGRKEDAFELWRQVLAVAPDARPCYWRHELVAGRTPRPCSQRLRVLG